ncbi:MAG: cupin domain-containing protein [Acidobacteriales bacterium]|nr:cupin domain-containing protein [Terriglobales bacterium]
MNATKLLHVSWNDVEIEPMTPLLLRQYVSCERITVARVQLKKGAVVARHSHEHEQVTCVLAGSLTLRFPDCEVTLRPGELLCIPGNLPHEAEAPEDCTVMDIFSPPRADWTAKQDAYMRVSTR